MAAVAVQVVIAAMGFEGPAEEFLAGGGVLGDQQDGADGGVAAGGVQIGQAGAVGGGVAVEAVAAIGGTAGEGACQRTAELGTAAALGIPLGCGALGEEPKVGGLDGMAELPGVTPAVGRGIGMGANHRQGRAGVARQGIDERRKGPKGGIELHPHPGGVLAGPLPAAWRKALAEHLVGHGAVGAEAPASLVRSSRPWPPIASHSLPSGGLK